MEGTQRSFGEVLGYIETELFIIVLLIQSLHVEFVAVSVNLAGVHGERPRVSLEVSEFSLLHNINSYLRFIHSLLKEAFVQDFYLVDLDLEHFIWHSIQIVITYSIPRHIL